MSSKIEQVIQDIEDFIEGCKFQPLSNTRILVDKEHMEELLRELRMKTPEEIKRYQKIISNKEAILNDAKAKAADLIAEAQAHTDHMVNEHEIMQQAYAQANEVDQQAVNQAQQIVDAASNDANNIRHSCMQYTDDMLAELQAIVAQEIEVVETRYGGLLAKLRECAAIIEKNRSDLYPQVGIDKDIASIEGTAPQSPAPASAAPVINAELMNKKP